MIILDSSVVIEILKGNPVGSKILEFIKDEEIFNTSITMQEVLLGARNFEKTLDYFNSIGIMNFEKEDAIKSAEIEKNLTKKGEKINKFDILIGAICINRNATLVTLDNDFNKIEGLKVKVF